MYPVILAIHNIFRWVVLILALVALIRAYGGWFQKREWTEGDRKAGSYFAISMDIQLLLGLLLYFVLAPWFSAVAADFGEAMQNPELRFFGLEHVFYMFIAVVMVHVGSVLARRAPESLAKFRRQAIWFTLATILILIAIPWWRPLLRLF